MKMTTTTKTFRNFLVANLCALLPLWVVAFGWMPDQVKVEARGSEPVALVVDGTVLQGEEHGTWKEGTVWRFYLRDGMAWKDLAFRLPEGMRAKDVGRVELQKWKLVKWGKDGRKMVPMGGGRNMWRFRETGSGKIGIARGKIPLGLVLFEVLLFGVSGVFAKRKGEESWRVLWVPAMLVALTLTMLMQVALPLQSWLANHSAYPFDGRDLATAVTTRFAWIFVLSTMALGLLTKCFGRWMLGLTLALAACIYLESGILSEGLPDLNGDWWFFQNKTRALWDIAVLGGVLVLLTGLHPFLKQHYVLASGCLLGLVAASMFDVKREGHVDFSKLIVDGFSSNEEVVRSVTYSSTRNVMVFILDSLERETAHAIMEDPETGAKLREQFKGFTEYLDNVGAASQTLTAVPNLLTGEYPDKPQKMVEYYWSIFTEQSVLKNYLEAGFDVYMTASGLGCGYASQYVEGKTENRSSTSVFKRPTKGGEQWITLEKLNRFRTLPFFAKAPYAYLMALTSGEDNLLREWAVYPMLMGGKVKEGSKGTFLFVHTDGVHIPILYDRRGNILPAADNSERGDKEMGIFLLGQLGELMDFFKNSNLYDASLIIVAADHGQHGEHEYFQAEATGILPGNAKPFLWVKPPRSRHPFKTSMLPTSHSRIAGLLKVVASKDVGEHEIEELLQADKRLYRWSALHGSGWKDWVVEKDGTVAFTETEYDATSLGAEMIPLQAGKAYSLSMSNTAKIKETILFSNVENLGYPALVAPRRGMAFSFRITDTNKQYFLRLKLKSWQQTGARFRQDLPGSEWKEIDIEANEETEVILRNLKPDSQGIITILGERNRDEDSTIRFVQLVAGEEE